ncbi:uncharacterized protein [Dysidea avara]|uniref:uncharacterized protein isoform X1 n=1 Tax=Dysidea avara TaxID=196820 RepID=UPI003323385F
MIVMDHNCTSLLACYSSGEVARSSGQFLQWQPSKTALDDLWPMMSGHSSSAINELLPLKNLVATMCGLFGLFSRSCSTSSSNYLQLVGITDLVSVLGDSSCC